jgi:predicted anti-sigma-YlaC factor YlaD
MTEHVDEDLLPLLTGELDRTETAAVAGHLRTCEACRGHLVDTAVVHGSLRSVSRSDAQLRAAVSDLLQSAADDGGVAEAAEDAWLPEVPESAELAGVQPPPGSSPARSRRRYRAAAVAAVAAVVIVGLVGLGWAVGRQTPASPGAPVSALASLRHVDAPAVATGVVVVRSIGSTRQMHIRIAGLGHAPEDQFYEVWLFQPATGKMLPVGILPPSGAASFELSASLMSQYSAIDVSLQVDDGDAAHSSHSVLRGPIQSVSA